MISVEHDYTSYFWNTGSTAQTITVQQNGDFWAEAINEYGCAYRDTVSIDFKEPPIVSLGADTSLCNGISYLLNVSGSGNHYTWQNKSTASTFLVQQAGIYFVEVEKDGCTAADSISIVYQSPPQIELGPDREICPGQTLTLSLTGQADSYKWSTGSTSTSVEVKQAGTYTVEAANSCGKVVDDVSVNEGACKVRMPNAFTPARSTNNLFRISNGYALQEFTMQVYNRWGQLIFKTNDPVAGWTGKINGIVQDPGTYVYTITFIEPETKTRYSDKGTFLLIR